MRLWTCRLPRWLIGAAVLPALVTHRSASATDSPPASEVLRLTLPQFVAGRADLQLLLYHRDGHFHHGYAAVPQRDNLPHRVDVTPARPFEFIFKDGSRPNITDKLKSTYAYHDPTWRKLAAQYEQGELLHRYTDEVSPLQWDRGARRLSGTVDVWIMPPDEANHWGLSPPKNFQNWRMIVAAEGADGQLIGTYQAWQYEGKDETFGENAPRVKGNLTGEWVKNHWQAQEGSEFARGKDWPQVRGPHLTMAADDCDQPLVDNLHDARLAWVAEEPITDGKGGAPKAAFGFYPANFSGWGYGAYAAPIVVDGRVYLHVVYPDREKLLADPDAARDILVRRGADVELVAAGHKARRFAVFCLDARTGRTLWRWFDDAALGHGSSGKSGKGLTACHFQGKLYVRGRGITCLDAATGNMLWQRMGRDRKDRAYSTGGGWSRDESPVIIGGVLVFVAYPGTTLIGLDPQNGHEIWRHERVTGYNSVPTKVVLESREYIISASGVQIGDDDIGLDNRLVLIEPRTGKILWESDLTGKNTVALLVDGSRVCGNGYRADTRAKDSKIDKTMRAACFEVTTAGAKRLWFSDKVGYPPHRATPVAHKGHFYIDSRQTGFMCVEAKTGRVVHAHPHIHALTRGDHNWTWHIASNNRLVTSGCLLFSTADEGFKRLPGRLSLDITSGYMCPVKPALADGRLFVRALNKLVCYDLRKQGGKRVDSVALDFDKPMLGYPDALNRCQTRLRIVDGRMTEAYTRLPRRSEVGAASISPLLAAPVAGLTLDEQRLAGTLAIRVGHHNEAWQINLKRDGMSFHGTCERRIAPLPKPLDVAGAIDGKIERKDDGATWRIFSLEGGATQRPSEPKHPRVVAHLVIETRQDGNVHHFVRAGRMNRATHELDASGLAIEAGRARGTVTVIFHADPWTAPNPGTSGPLAATYRIDARINGETITGTYKGALGVQYRASSAVTGSYRAGKDID
jgi:outer membrane protein assembly factor BamB